MKNVPLSLDINIFDASPYLVVFVNKKGDILYLNKKAAEILSPTTNFFNFINLDIDQKKLVKNKKIASQHHIHNKTIKIIWMLSKKSNDKLLFLGIVKKQINKSSDARILQNIVDNIPHAVFWKDRKSRILGCNKQFAVNAGYERAEDIIGKTDYELPWKKYADKYVKDDQEVMLHRKSKLVYEEENIEPSGTIKTVLVSKVPLFDDFNKINGVLGIFTDITQLKELEKIRQRQIVSIEVINKLKLMAGVMAHELRTPLAGINLGLGGIEKNLLLLLEAYDLAKQAGMIQAPMKKSTLENLKGLVKRMKMQVHTCNNFIDMQLKNINLMNIDKSLFTICSIKEIINEALDTYPFVDNQEQLISVDKNINFTFYGDAVLAKHILWNLIKNSLYQIHSVGKGKISMWSTTDKNYNNLHFKDTAKGISEDLKAKIFDKFFTTDTEGTGAGIGLSYIKLVMQAFEGMALCESEEGKFIEFILKFPKLKETTASS